jgi:hypothetical protein
MALFPLMATVLSFAFMLGMLLMLGSATGIASTAALTILISNELRRVSLSLAAMLSVLVAPGGGPTAVTLVADILNPGSDVRLPLTIVGLLTSLAGTLAFVVATARAARGALIPSPNSRRPPWCRAW